MISVRPQSISEHIFEQERVFGQSLDRFDQVVLKIQPIEFFILEIGSESAKGILRIGEIDESFVGGIKVVQVNHVDLQKGSEFNTDVSKEAAYRQVLRSLLHRFTEAGI